MTQSIPQTTKIEPGSETHFALLGAEFGYNFLGGHEYRYMQQFAKKVWDAALSQPMGVAGIPPGMALVPIEPTDEMCQAALDCQDHDPEDGPECEMYCLYQAMVAAAPQPQAVQQDRGEAPVCADISYPDTLEKVLARLEAGTWDPTLIYEAAKRLRDLSASPPPAPQREPLTDGVIAAIFDATRYDSGCGSRAGLVRAIEAAHGIGTPTKGVDHG